MAIAFDQTVVDACKSVRVASSTDLHGFFAAQGGFYKWYNQALSGTPAFAHRGKASLSAATQGHFDVFWDQTPVIFGRPAISLIEFCALMSVNIQETTGDLSGPPEEMNGLSHPHPGLAYAFDKIAGLKQSYNHAPNRTALSLFGDARFKAAHGQRPGADDVLHRPGGIDTAWGGETWPAGFPPNVDENVNGFVMEADFFKFRGRGVIQTTWRDDYKILIGYILAATTRQLQLLAAKWNGMVDPALPAAQKIDAIATVSSNDDWASAFGLAQILAAGVALDSDAKGHYLNLSGQEATLSADKKTPGSLLFMAGKINGGNYPATVAPMMKAMMCEASSLVAGGGA